MEKIIKFKDVKENLNREICFFYIIESLIL